MYSKGGRKSVSAQQVSDARPQQAPISNVAEASPAGQGSSSNRRPHHYPDTAQRLPTIFDQLGASKVVPPRVFGGNPGVGRVGVHPTFGAQAAGGQGHFVDVTQFGYSE